MANEALPTLNQLISGANSINFYNYQKQAGDTAIYPERGEMGGMMYLALGLASEAGEVAGKLKKLYRDGPYDQKKSDEFIDDLGKEIADVLWYLAMIAEDSGLDLGKLAKGNLDKLASRKKRGVIGGSGDNR